jgi:phage terminase large subunit-like protein
VRAEVVARINGALDPTTEYARAVCGGEVIAGPHVRDACKRHLDDLKHGAARGLRWDAEAAQRFFDFCRTVLRLSEGQFDGIPFELHPSQKFICGSLFGWMHGDVRRFQRAYIEQGKGNGKSPMVGAIGLYGLTADGESGAQIYSAGATKEQAGILFADAVKMVNQAPALNKRIDRAGGPGREYNLAHLPTQSFFRPVSRETKKTGSGPRPHMALCDEVHEHPDGGVIEILERGFKFRRQPLLVMITNSGSDRASICWAERKHAVAVAAGDVEDDRTFSYVCAMDEGDEPFDDPECWEKANPLIGVTITREYLERNVKQARDIPAKANGIRRLHFCQWTDAESAWISRAAWEEIEDPTLDIDDYEGAACYAGLDLSQTTDLTAKALVFEDGETEDGLKKYAAFVHGYTPEDTMRARGEKDGLLPGQDYAAWVEEGFLTATPGKKVRLSYVASDLYDDAQRFELRMCAYDNYLIRSFEDELDELGASLPLVDHPQNFLRRTSEVDGLGDVELWMPGSVDALETLVLEGRIRVHVNKPLRWAVASATFAEGQDGQRRFTKAKATGRIDMAVALAMAVGAAEASGGVAKAPPTPWDADPDYRLVV